MARRRLTLSGLVAEAHAAGYDDVDERLVKWWVSVGLLDQAQVGRSRGRGKGVPRFWFEPQRDLLLALLRNRAREARRIPTLCNLPVAWWLYRGDAVVPLRQTKRAMQTWFDKTQRTSWTRSTHSAKELVSMFLPDLRGEARDKIVHAFANITYAGRFDGDTLRTQLRAAAGPGNAVTSGGETSYVTDLAVGPIEAILCARDRLAEIPDDLYRFARAELQQSATEYVAALPRLAENPHLGHLATPLTVDVLGNRACAHLAQLLGHLLLAGDKTDRALRGRKA